MVERAPGAGFVCRVAKNTDALLGFGQVPLLLVQYQEAEARRYALERAKALMPEEDGWTNHDAVLIELPRSTFIEMQLFITTREFFHRALRLFGFTH